MTHLRNWLFEPVPKGRIAAFRTLVYLFVALDVVFFSAWIKHHGDLPGNLYQPLVVGRLLPLPTPTPLVVGTIYWALIPLSLAAATGRAHRLLGWSVFVLYFEWMIIAMSYGKIDHDRFGLLVALAVLPTAGRARHGDPETSEAGGWALRLTQIGVICTYFLASIAKLRFGGLAWLTGATLTRSFIRRGTALAHWLLGIPGFTTASQIGIVGFELFSPLVFVLKPKLRYAMVAGFYAFHVLTFSLITISFIPHQVAMTSFLPLERVTPVVWARRLLKRGTPATDDAPGDDPATTGPAADERGAGRGGSAAEQAREEVAEAAGDVHQRAADGLDHLGR
ncbi:MFS transporter permease [Dactylosporangium aurantiacum]|uniref:MFS transporter permease n=1 Tax=Dactylosporangium aurantiacum TaxID=35754 RepID=A0A9Q9IFP6_9ACTN|nr:MFS transporter permease [Dactylosporangium aurantiacum]UWZ55364.1 MFS transporter permease [Dactylosporangium aurantiacum]